MGHIKRFDSGGPFIRGERPQNRNPFSRKERDNFPEEDEATEEERKAKLEYERRLRARAIAKLAMGEHNLNREEKKAVKTGTSKNPLSVLHTLRGSNRKLIRQEGEKVAKEKVKKEIKKRIKKATAKRVLAVLVQTAPIWAPILVVLVMCLFGFLALMYYTCEGGGIIAWLLRRTALGGLCSM